MVGLTACACGPESLYYFCIGLGTVLFVSISEARADEYGASLGPFQRLTAAPV